MSIGARKSIEAKLTVLRIKIYKHLNEAEKVQKEVEVFSGIVDILRKNAYCLTSENGRVCIV